MAGRGERRCQICGRPIPAAAVAGRAVFCSERCRMVDLGRWLDGAYVIPGPAADADVFSEATGDEDAAECDGDGVVH